MFGLLLSACAEVATPTPTPGRVLSGPTVEASPPFVARRATSVPFDEVYEGQNDPTAAALPSGGALPPLPVGGALGGGRARVTVTAEDGALLPGDLYQGGAVRLPGVLMLATDTAAWGDFPMKVHQAGFTVLVVSPRDRTALADFRVLLQALTSGEVDPGHIGVIGAGDGADVALLGCSGELLCDTLVLLSPSNNATLLEALKGFNPRPIFLTASRNDAPSFALIQSLHGAATGEKLLQPFEDAGRGADMLRRRPDLGDLMIGWLKRQLVES
jgi:hypothetical protein